jgi:two-component system NarL family response regulator
VSEAAPITVLVADDHLVLRLGLVTLINNEPDMRVVGQAANGHELIRLYGVHRPQLVLMDLRMPRLSGADTIAGIIAIDPGARIVVLTIHKGDEAVYQALRAGARGYLLKDVTSQNLVAGLRAVHAGEQYIPAPVAARLAYRISHGELTEGEVDVLRHIARGLSNKQIAERVNISPDTAAKRVTALLAKLGAKDRTHAVALALERGIIDLDDSSAAAPADPP